MLGAISNRIIVASLGIRCQCYERPSNKSCLAHVNTDAGLSSNVTGAGLTIGLATH